LRRSIQKRRTILWGGDWHGRASIRLGATLQYTMPVLFVSGKQRSRNYPRRNEEPFAGPPIIVESTAKQKATAREIEVTKEAAKMLNGVV
jgi:hypothetical protein